MASSYAPDTAVPSAIAWRSTLPPTDGTQVDDVLLDRIACCDDALRGRLISHLDSALGAGVCDPITLHTIVDTVTAAPGASGRP